MYLIQVLLGFASHFTRGPTLFFFLHRTPQRVLHILLGLAIFGLAFYQVHYGYTIEWINIVGLPVPASVNKGWMALVIVSNLLCIWVRTYIIHLCRYSLFYMLWATSSYRSNYLKKLPTEAAGQTEILWGNLMLRMAHNTALLVPLLNAWNTLWYTFSLCKILIIIYCICLSEWEFHIHSLTYLSTLKLCCQWCKETQTHALKSYIT